jgi:lipopolysaccharide/colanic/teichoic acid biosynthesis glycosyltransferase
MASPNANTVTLEYDLHDVDLWSIWSDLRTVFMALLSKQAYFNAY